jgi:SAM-dependent methyltransferase
MLRSCQQIFRRKQWSLRANMAQKTCYAAERNKEPILNVLKPVVEEIRAGRPDPTVTVLEIASGTGEHAHMFASNIDNLYYQPTDPDIDMHESIVAWTKGITNSKVNPPVPLDVTTEGGANSLPPDFQDNTVDLIICINMIHITPFRCTEDLFSLAAKCLRPGGYMLTYGPYRVNGHMVESNVKFDESLKARNPEWGVRDVEVVAGLAQKNGLVPSRTVEMPANNLTLLFKKLDSLLP